MSYIEYRTEESPRYEGAPTTAPTRISTVAKFMPITAARINPAPQHIDRADELRNIEGSVPRILDEFQPDGNITERAYPNLIPFILLINGWQATITPGGAGVMDPDGGAIPAGATRIVFTKRGGLTAKTAQLILAYDEAGVFLKGQGFGCNNLTLNAAGEMSADLTGIVVQRIADPALTPSYDSQAIHHFRRADMQLTWLTGSGESDDFTLASANPLERRDSFGTTLRSYYPDKLFHGNERVAVTGSIPKYSLDADDVDALLAASTFSGTAKWISDIVIGATTYKYSMWLQMPSCQLIGGQADELGNRRRYGASYDWFAAWDETAGFDAKWTIVCATAALETFV